MASKRESEADPGIENNLAALRKKRGFSAAALAGQAGINRQTIYAIEAGQYVPNTTVALRLASALQTPVEDVFRLRPSGVPAPRLQKAEIIAMRQPLQPGQPVDWCRVGNRIIGVPAMPVPSYLLPANSFVVHAAAGAFAKTTLQPTDSTERERLLVAGCDPAMSVLARHLHGDGVELVLAPVNSSEALRLLHAGKVHIAGTHLQEEAGNQDNLPAIRTLFSATAVSIITFALWEEGLLTAAGNPKRIKAIDDLVRKGIRLVNREPGAGSRRLLDKHLKKAGIRNAQVRGYQRTCGGHLEAAWQIASGQADCCVATCSAARAFGLDFIPLTCERYDLVVRKEDVALPAIARLLDTLSRGSFRRELEDQGGYDTRQTGQHIG